MTSPLCKIWGFHCGDYEECRLVGYKNPVRTSQETHYVSATKTSQLMLCKIWCFHGCDFEEYRLLGYKHPVRTSQETNYVSATEHSLLILFMIWGFHGGDYEEFHLLGCYAVWVVRTNVSLELARATRHNIPEDGIFRRTHPFIRYVFVDIYGGNV
jgi:uncharacterized membrane protein